MKAAYYSSFNGPISIEQLPDPSPCDDDVILKINASGLCLSDWHGWKGHDPDISLPHVPGHELAGEIVELGKNVEGWNIGQRVTVPFVCGCGICETCHGGNPQVCPHQTQPGFTYWGSFAEFVAIKYAAFNLVHIPDFISDTTAASLGCRFATSFRAVVEQGKVQEGEWVVVFGCGGVGLAAIMIAKAYGARVIAIDKKESALEKAMEIGAQVCINSAKMDRLSEKIIDDTSGGAHLSIDAIGHSQVFIDSLNSLRRRGRHIQIGLFDPELPKPTIALDRIIAFELEVKGSHGMQAFRYSEMIQLIEKGILKPDWLIDKTMTLEEGIQELPSLPNNEGSGVRIITQF